MSGSPSDKSLSHSGFKKKGGYGSGPPSAKLPKAPRGPAPGVSKAPGKKG